MQRHHARRTSETVSPTCCRHLAGRGIGEKPCRQDAGSTLRFAESCGSGVAQCRQLLPGATVRLAACNPRPATRMSIPFTEIAGQKLNSEQVAYLEGLFAGLKNRGLTFSDIKENPVGQSNGAAAG